jgi:hypothetical protein
MFLHAITRIELQLGRCILSVAGATKGMFQVEFAVGMAEKRPELNHISWMKSIPGSQGNRKIQNY